MRARCAFRRLCWLLALWRNLCGVASASKRRIKVLHIAPVVGRHFGGLPVNVSGQGAHASRSLNLRHRRTEEVAHSDVVCRRDSCHACIGFLVSTNPKCRFGAMEVVATVQSPSLMQCVTPRNTDYGPATPYGQQAKVLEVSLNGVDWTQSKKTFTFYGVKQACLGALGGY